MPLDVLQIVVGIILAYLGYRIAEKTGSDAIQIMGVIVAILGIVLIVAGIGIITLPPFGGG